MKYSDPKFPRKLFIVGSIFFLFGLVGFVGMFVKRILAGQGDQLYFEALGYQFSYLGTLSLVGFGVGVVFLVIYLRIRPDYEERAFVRHMEQKRNKNRK
ncbi:MAG: hypothetical protein ABW157_13445 [Candidatus Thiodiazotropha sp. LLP2]